MPGYVGCRGALRRVRRGSRWTGLLAALLATPALSLPVFGHPSATARPAPEMWVVSDQDTTIYLFGTFHALDSSTDWFSPRIRAAFSSSDQLVLETIIPTDPAQLLASLRRHRLVNEPVAGQPVVATHTQGFAASAGQTVAAGKKLGLSADNGADAVLSREALRTGKTLAGLESFDSQIAMFTRLSALPAPAATVPGSAPISSSLLDMRSAWASGSSTQFAALLGSIERQSPETYRILFTDRNERWADWVRNRLATPGTVFVAVGAGHLTGRDSVQAKLSRRGIRTVKVS